MVSRFMIGRVLFVICFVMTLFSCTNLDEVNSRLDTLEGDVRDLKTACARLENAYKDGKIVTSVKPQKDDNDKQIGWVITFSDNTNITLVNGKDGNDAVAPLVRINPVTNCWEISDDAGLGWKDTGVKAIGNDAVAPLVRINPETYNWEISSDNGVTWQDTGYLAVGNDGDSFFESVRFRDGLVVFTMKDGSVFTFSIWTSPKPKITNLEFLSGDNPLQLVSNVSCTILGDSIISCRVPHIMSNKKLIPRITFEGDGVFTLEGEQLESGKSRCDFSKPFEVVVKLGEEETRYKIYVHAFTGLPTIWIETEGRNAITSKEEYLNAHFKLVEDVVTRGPGDVCEYDVSIKGRGNNTWVLPPKKSYRLKFNQKVSLLGEPEDKSWILLANYYDKTMIRSTAAFYMGSISRLSYTPRYHFVELFLNGRYDGTYQLIEKLKISKNRLNIGDDGFLIEVDNYAPSEEDARYFQLDSLLFSLNIKDPAVEYDSQDFLYVKNFFEEAEKALYSDAFTDAENGWQKYIDIETAVDYYIINEICKSCESYYLFGYFNLQRGGKIKFGPLWDYDKCFGNYAPYYGCEYPEGFWLKEREWFKRLFQDPTFVDAVKSRFPYFYDRKDEIFRVLNDNANYLKYSVVENDNRWNVLNTPNMYDPHDYDIWGGYQNEVTSLKTWIEIRFEWLKAAFEGI